MRMKTVLVMGSGIMIAALLSAPRGEALQIDSVDYQDVLTTVVERARAIPCGRISSRRESFTLDNNAYARVKSQLQMSCLAKEHEKAQKRSTARAGRKQAHTTSSPMTGAKYDFGSLFTGSDVQPLLSWREDYGFVGDLWRCSRELVPQRSSYLEELDELAAISGRLPRRPPAREVVSWDGVVERLLTSDDTEVRRPERYSTNPLRDYDMSLAGWEAALDGSAPLPPNQRVHAEKVGSRLRVVFTNNGNSPDETRVIYEFSSVLDGAPISVTFLHGGDIVREILYGYGSLIHDSGAVLPSIVSDAVMMPEGSMTVELLMIDNWDHQCDDSTLEFRVPPIRFVVEYNGRTEPDTYVEKPGYLKGLDPCEEPTELLRMIISDIGGDAERSDLNVDGVVSADDLLLALRKYQW